ncbi:molybdenum ABC transporter ATP-binding protein [Aurantimonas aggregata]|uniref:Molybdenum ABC transporter ATP-binding protein n=1 Tax=Aurantimonas aggregata TaxID=2047720 RepID=A0A6L9MKV0_9HYPH|nr:molybdenum ABC transporter ATP-binding protein [Aurantimonas aggregata]NDV88256.1 molybdenum ABC transporter ATP-binding protein [Aurantimonas aggregata]
MTLSVAIRHRFGAFSLDVAFEAPKGVTVLYGRSGSGKTTLVNAVAGLLRPDAGRVSADDWLLFDTAARHWLAPHRRRIGYIFQEGRLFPHLSVRQNLAYGRRFAPKAAPREDPARVIDMLGIGHLLDRRPAMLSGGEKQRVAIGRALLSAPRLILADEPLASLDDQRKAEILPYFERLRDEVAIPILYVSHSASEVARLATTVVALGHGRVTAVGTAQDVLGDPQQVLGIRDAASLLTGRVVAHHDVGLSELATAGGALFLPRVAGSIGTRLRVRIAAQDVILSRARPEGLSALNILKGHVDHVRPGQGPGAMVALRLGDETLLARITQRSASAMDLQPGETCHAILKTVAVAPEDVGRAVPAIEAP